jgi:hypothetical protein
MIHDIIDIKKAFRKTIYCVSVSKTIFLRKLKCVSTGYKGICSAVQSFWQSYVTIQKHKRVEKKKNSSNISFKVILFKKNLLLYSLAHCMKHKKLSLCTLPNNII